MNPTNVELILTIAFSFSIIVGVSLTRVNSARKQRNKVRERLDLVLGSESKDDPINEKRSLLKPRQFISDNPIAVRVASFNEKWNSLLQLAGWKNFDETIQNLALLLLFAPIILAAGLSLDLFLGTVAGVVLASIPFIAVFIKAATVRKKFVTQLPEAIDLIVSVLRTGHSIPRAVQTVGEEIAHPCGTEFKEILQRINLGQPLSEALSSSCQKYSSYELDLIRRAVAIQAEVGGSLAELLEKTNYTLRQRIKLARHVKVLTSQSRLTAIIVGMLPLIMAAVLNMINPGYLNPLVENPTGKALLLFAIGLQVTGIFIMRRLSTIKV